MKLSEIHSTKPSLKKLNKITESRFGFKLDYESITLPKALSMRKKIHETVNRIRKSSDIHKAEQNPKYLEMLIVYEGLSRWIDAHRIQKLNEGELGTAEAILAAKDMVDTAQDMIEKIGKMQNEQMPALIDSIRDQIGSEQADAFKNSVGQVLTTLSQQVGQAREQLDGAARGLTGEGAPDPMAMGGAPGAEDPSMAGGAGMPGGGMDMGADMPSGPEDDGFGGADAAAGGPEDIGRELR